MPLIRYVGKKASKFDNVAGSGTLWACPGDDKEVTDAVAAKLLVHPDVWALTEAIEVEAAPPPEDDQPEAPVRFTHEASDPLNLFRLRDTESDEIIDLAVLDTPALKAFTRTNGLKVDLRKKDDELRSLIVATVIHAADPKP